jgi:hypothetical protein
VVRAYKDEWVSGRVEINLAGGWHVPTGAVSGYATVMVGVMNSTDDWCEAARGTDRGRRRPAAALLKGQLVRLASGAAREREGGGV